jgi:hypothetical protein
VFSEKTFELLFLSVFTFFGAKVHTFSEKTKFSRRKMLFRLIIDENGEDGGDGLSPLSIKYRVAN